MMVCLLGRPHEGRKFREPTLDGPKTFRILRHPSTTCSRHPRREGNGNTARISKFDRKQAFLDTPNRLVTLSKRKSLAEPVTETTMAGCLQTCRSFRFAVAAAERAAGAVRCRTWTSPPPKSRPTRPCSTGTFVKRIGGHQPPCSRDEFVAL